MTDGSDFQTALFEAAKKIAEHWSTAVEETLKKAVKKAGFDPGDRDFAQKIAGKFTWVEIDDHAGGKAGYLAPVGMEQSAVSDVLVLTFDPKEGTFSIRVYEEMPEFLKEGAKV